MYMYIYMYVFFSVDTIYHYINNINTVPITQRQSNSP